MAERQRRPERIRSKCRRSSGRPERSAPPLIERCDDDRKWLVLTRSARIGQGPDVVSRLGIRGGEEQEASRACCFPACMGSTTTEDSSKVRVLSLPKILPSPSLNKVGVLNWVFEAQRPACRCLYRRFSLGLATHSARLEVRMVRVCFPVRLFHSLHHAGLSRRTQRHRNSARSAGRSLWNPSSGSNCVSHRLLSFSCTVFC